MFIKDIFEALTQKLHQFKFESEAEENDFISFVVKKLYEDYQLDCMDREKVCQTLLSDLKLQNQLKNGSAREPYSVTFTIPESIVDDFEIKGLEESGIQGLTGIKEGNTYTISGTPVLANPKSPQEIVLTLNAKYKGWVEGKPLVVNTLRFVINANPRDLWNDNPTPTDIEYFKPDEDCCYVKVAEKDGNPQKDIVAASMRGRSHANENPGKPRDDDFNVTYSEKTGWYVLAVADGAGSAKFSRWGSKIAVETSVDHCLYCLENTEEFEKYIAAFNEAKANGETDKETELNKAIGQKLYSILCHAAHKSHKAIKEECEARNVAIREKAAQLFEEQKALNPNAVETKPIETQVKDYATTLLLAICKKFEFGWFVATWWVGDGAIGLYKKGESVKIMGEPDEGEFGGQTRFLTMSDIVGSFESLYKRMRFGIEPEFTALMLMTDGISDPKFETDVNLKSVEKWDALWADLEGDNEEKIGVDFADDNEEAKDQLLNWSKFYSKSNHDDRTIAILY